MEQSVRTMVQRVGIVGCGIVGAAIAHRLSQNSDYQVSVWESKSEESFGATGSALGVLMAVISPKLKGKHLKMRLDSIQSFDPWIESLQSQTGMTIPYNQQGIVQLMFDPEQFQRWEKTESVRQRQGFPLERWSRAETLEHFPFIEAAKELESGQGFVGAIYSPSDRQLDPVALTQACRKAAIQNGAQIHYNSPVEIGTPKSTESKKQLKGIRVNGEFISVDILILSAGLSSTSLTTALQQTIPIRPVLGQALRLKLASPWPIPTPVINGAHVHLIPLNSHELWVGATVEFPDPETGQPFTANPQTLEQLRKQAIALYPELARAEVVESWSGLRPRPVERAAPIIEWLPNYQNVIVATGHYRNGVLLAPMTANCVEAMLGDR